MHKDTTNNLIEYNQEKKDVNRLYKAYWDFSHGKLINR